MLARIFAVSVFSLMSVPAFAQQAQAPVIYQLKLEAKQVGEVAEALGALPYSRVAPLIQEIGRQIQEQNQAREWEKKTPAAPIPTPQEPQK